MLDVSIEVVSVMRDMTRTSDPGAGAGAAAVEASDEDRAVTELAAASAAGSAASFAAPDAAAPPAEPALMAEAPRWKRPDRPPASALAARLCMLNRLPLLACCCCAASFALPQCGPPNA